MSHAWSAVDNMTEKEARELLDKFHRAFPSVRQWAEKMLRKKPQCDLPFVDESLHEGATND